MVILLVVVEICSKQRIYVSVSCDRETLKIQIPIQFWHICTKSLSKVVVHDFMSSPTNVKQY